MESAVVRNLPEQLAAARVDPKRCLQLAEQNWGLIVRVADQRLTSAQGVGFEFADLIDIGLDTVLSHSKLYDPTRNASYAHFIAMCMHQEISKAIDHRRRVNRRVRVISLESPLQSGYTDLVVGDTIGYHERAYDTLLEPLSRSQQWEHIEPLLDELEQLERQVLQLYYWENMPYRTIAQLVGCSHEWVRRLRNLAIEKLRSALRRRGLWPEE